MKISIIIPVFNEVKTLEEIIKKIEALNLEKEIITVDDGSSDGSSEILIKLMNEGRIKFIRHQKNLGKGAAIKSGLKEATGDIVIIQDADLETEPGDYYNLIRPILNKETQAVFGYRTAKKPASIYWWGGKSISLITKLLYGGGIKDVNNGYKVMTRDLWNSLELKSNHFQICEEITAKLLKRKEKIIQVPTQYFPRTKKEGKKLGFKDGIISLWTLLKYRINENIRKIIIANLLFVILITFLFGYLTVRALPDSRMDMMSAQTLLAARWWVRDGFAKNYFLQLVAGYGKVVRYFEEPKLNEHARGTVAGGLIGHKIYYTHYPSLYILPTAFMMKLGVEKLFFFRLFSIILSISALIFFYVFVKLLTNKTIAFVAVFYFSISPIFIGDADSLYHFSMENIWRFLILMFSILAINCFKSSPISPRRAKYYLASIWISYFLLALTSFNSTFFIFTWLAGLSAFYIYNSSISHKIKMFLFLAAFWASAPIIGFILQLFQNVAYLGWHDTLLDIYGAFNFAGNRTTLEFITRAEALIRPFFSITGILNIYYLITNSGIAKIKRAVIASNIPTVYILPFLIIFTAAIFLKLKKITGYKVNHLFILLLLVIAPLAQTLILPFTGFKDEMGGLTAPFIGIIIGAIAWMLYLAFLKRGSLTVLNKIFFVILFLIIIGLFGIQIAPNFTPRFRLPYAVLTNSEIAFANSMKKITKGERVVFMINMSDTRIPEEELKKRLGNYSAYFYRTDYYNVWEYYFDIPLLNFIKTDYLIKDLLFLRKRAEFPFTAIVTSDSKVLIDEIYQKLYTNQLSPKPVEIIENRYFFIISPSIP